MRPSNPKGSEMERSASAGSSNANPDDDDRSFAAAAIADGFRPTVIEPELDSTQSSYHSTSSLSPSEGNNSSQSPTSSTTDVPSTQIPPRPSSITKPPRAHDSLALRHDGAMGHLAGSRLSRASGSMADSPILRSDSPYQGPSAPSHPYQSYPQRTLSSATSSTAPASDRSYTGPQRPTHPYGLYTQTTAPSDPNTTADIPVGFGRPDNYQRRIGPDGEEIADLIGPLGHTEELPPYTRYPEQAYAAKPPAAVPEEPDSHHDTNSPQPIPGAGGIGLATRNPEYESRDDLASPPSQSRLSTRSDNSDSASQHRINTAAADAFDEKKQGGSKWQQRARKRVWGVVPYWAVVLAAAAILVVGIVLGAVIGTVFGDSETKDGEKPDEDAYPITYTTATQDTIPIATKPADLPPLEVGTFSLPPLVSSEAPTTCFNDTSQAQAWTCNIPFTVYSMSISKIPNAVPTSEYTLQMELSNSSSSSDLYTWGTQPPAIDDPIRMRLVNDTEDQDLGPAWFAQVSYNKTVIIAEDRFPNVDSDSSYSSSSDKRDAEFDFDPADDFRRAGVLGAQAGDKPWICTWPGTLLEVFIYPYQNNSFSESDDDTSISASSSQAPTGSSSSSPSTITPAPDSDKPSSVSSSDAPSSTRSTNIAAPPYPKIMKIEESRVSDDDSRAAVCQQVEIEADGMSSKPVVGDDGDPIEVIIVENQRLVAYRFEESKRSLSDPYPLLVRRKEHYSQLSECGCMWSFT